MTINLNNTKKLNSSTDETKGILEKYEMKKLNKYVVIATIAIINLASLIAIYQINNSWNVIINPDLVLFATIQMGIIIALLSAFFLYFNKKTNFLIDERIQKSGKLKKIINTLEEKTNQITPLVDDRSVMKSLLSLAIEKTLLEIGKFEYEETVNRLAEDHKCSLLDCFDDPEYLKRVLSNLFGKSYDSVLESIKENLKEFKSDESVQKFLTVMIR